MTKIGRKYTFEYLNTIKNTNIINIQEYQNKVTLKEKCKY